MSDSTQKPKSEFKLDALRNLLDFEADQPSPALKYAAERLLGTGMQVGRTSKAETAAYLDPQTHHSLVVNLANAIEHNCGFQGKALGPVSQAVQAAESYLDQAIALGYRVADPQVKSDLAYYVLAIFTDGFVGKKPGTTTGESKVQFGHFTFKDLA